jgi:hypothetical protein
METEENSEKQSRIAVYSNSFKLWQATAEVSLHLTKRLLYLLLFLASFFLAYSSTPKMESVHSPETLVNFYHGITSPGGSTLQYMQGLTNKT